MKNCLKYIMAKMLKTLVLLLMLGVSAMASPREKGNDQKPPLKNVIIDPGHGGIDGGAHGVMSHEAVVALEIGLKVRDLMQKEIPDLNIMMTRESDELPGHLSNRNAALKWRADFANRNGGDLFISIHLNASPANQRYGKKQIGTRQETYYVYQGKGKKRKKIAKTHTVPVYERFKLPQTVLGTQTYILASDWYNQKVNTMGKNSEIYATGETDSLDQEMLQVDPVEARIRAAQYARYFFQKSLTLASYVEEEFGNVGRYSWGVQQRDWQGIWVLQATQMPSILIETGYIDHTEEEQYLNSQTGQDEVARCIVNAVKRYKSLLENPERISTPPAGNNGNPPQ